MKIMLTDTAHGYFSSQISLSKRETAHSMCDGGHATLFVLSTATSSLSHLFCRGAESTLCRWEQQWVSSFQLIRASLRSRNEWQAPNTPRAACIEGFHLSSTAPVLTALAKALARAL